MKIFKIEPKGWKCRLKDCPNGLFISGDNLCFKSEYADSNGNIEAFCMSGETFSGNYSNDVNYSDYDRENLLVQPVEVEWEIIPE